MDLASPSRTYAARRDAPFSDSSTLALKVKSALWAFKAYLKGEISTGVLAGVRHANSLWTCYQSCDSTTVGTTGDGIDRWGAVFDGTKIVQAASGAAHSWIILYNAYENLYLTIDVNNATAGWRGFVSRTAPSGGTTTAGPLQSTDSWGFYSAAAGDAATNNSSTFIVDTVTGGNDYAHFVTTNTGEFIFFITRSGLGWAPLYISLWSGDDPQGVDNWNRMALFNSVNTGRGTPTQSALTTSNGCTARCQDSTRMSTGGLQVQTYGGSSLVTATGVLGGSSKYDLEPLHFVSVGPQHCKRGNLKDMYWHNGSIAPGSPLPSATALEYLAVGDGLIPFPSTAVPQF